jgi:hypothetical protein
VLVCAWLLSTVTAVLQYLNIDGASWYAHAPHKTRITHTPLE